MTHIIGELAVCVGLLVLIWMAVQGRKGDKEWCAARDRRRMGIWDD